MTDCWKPQPTLFAQLTEIQTTRQPGVHHQVKLQNFLSAQLSSRARHIDEDTLKSTDGRLSLFCAATIDFGMASACWIAQPPLRRQISSAVLSLVFLLPIRALSSSCLLWSGKGSLPFLFSCPMQQPQSGSSTNIP